MPDLTANDDTATTNKDTPVGIPVLANDTLDGQPVQLADLAGPPTVVSQPINGTVTVHADGSMTYDPNPGFVGVDSFEYEIDLPAPEDCAGMEVSPYTPTVVEFTDAMPSWYHEDTVLFALRFEGSTDVYMLQWNEQNARYESTTKFPAFGGQDRSAQIALPEGAPENEWDWSCVNVFMVAPA